MENSQKVLLELKAERSLRDKWRVIYVSTSEDLEILNDACRAEWRIISSTSDYLGGIFYTLQR